MSSPIQSRPPVESTIPASTQSTQGPRAQGVGAEPSRLASMEESSSGEGSPSFSCCCLKNFFNWIRNLLATLCGSSASLTEEACEAAPTRRQVSHDELIETVAQCFQRDCRRIDMPYPLHVVVKVSINAVPLNIDIGTIQEAPAIEAYRQAFQERVMPSLRQVDLETEANQNLMVLSVRTYFYHKPEEDENYSMQSFPHEINYVLGRPQAVQDLPEGHHENISVDVMRGHLLAVAGEDRNLRRSLQELLISDPLDRTVD